MGWTAAQDLPGQTVVVGRAVQQMCNVRGLHLVGLGVICFVQPGHIHLVVVPIARVDRHRSRPVACGLHPQAHAVPLGQRVAFLQIRKAQHLRPARYPAQHGASLLDITDKVRKRHLRRSQAAVPGRVVAHGVACTPPVPDEVQPLTPAGTHQ